MDMRDLQKRARREIRKDFCDFCRFYVVEIVIIVAIGTSPAHVLSNVLMDEGHDTAPTHAESLPTPKENH